MPTKCVPQTIGLQNSKGQHGRKEPLMIQLLSLINLFVRNVQRSREFYSHVLEIPVVTSDDQ